MISVHVKAIFKGANGSCGYKEKTEYNLSIKHTKGESIKIENLNSSDGGVEYDSMVSFLQNWDNIRH